MTSSRSPDLRALIADVVREVVADLAGPAAAATPAPAPVPPAAPAPPAGVAGAEHVTAPQLRERVEAVRIGDDADLDRFARQLLALFENPKNRQDLRAGRLRFRLEGGTTSAVPETRPVQRVDTGAVTERQVKAASEAGRRLVLGRRAVLTPLARERARALGVPIEKER
ncbi:hypothetical protein ACFJIY_17565 [Pimelobacter simplex]|uniref:Uncharacterized protein n=2 Tax=Nocardioides simplex TaxID=2045 RepID=A0A0A1DQR6_NOCSI|nr:hypothetical protein [Pimelobacter simplex]AIY18883.1 hypothetical protein KR76_22700 [Pimelobacter simplex]GEB14616.1 hypothetical protein NSI01_29310 [Pimelobacter simplex]SFM27670.1 hypothetical protein SAMN05421671_0800 [Pimelobacter simplex]